MIWSSGAALMVLAHLGPASITPGAAADDRTGFYLLLAESNDRQKLPTPTADQQVVRYEAESVGENPPEPPRYLLIADRPDVPLTLAQPPKRILGDEGRTHLLLELTKHGAERMAEVTRRNVGKEVAFLIDGEVVSTHKIREAITGGHFKVSRCGDDACEVIYGRLTQR